ncbi:hypothetical protein L7F22_059688 [Adiantum nelumboides]|nr:hypothetical protein [Adiantum nelumboides]
MPVETERGKQARVGLIFRFPNLIRTEKRAGKPNGLKNPCSVWEEIASLRKLKICNPLSLINFLENRERTISNTIRDAEERHTEATEKLRRARLRLQQAEMKAAEIRIIGLTQMDRERQDLVDAADNDLKLLEDSKNYSIRLEKRRAIEQVRQQVSRLASERAFESLNSRLTNELQLRMIDYHIGLFRAMANKST